jgi:hypothetical protein
VHRGSFQIQRYVKEDPTAPSDLPLQEDDKGGLEKGEWEVFHWSETGEGKEGQLPVNLEWREKLGWITVGLRVEMEEVGLIHHWEKKKEHEWEWMGWWTGRGEPK